MMELLILMLLGRYSVVFFNAAPEIPVMKIFVVPSGGLQDSALRVEFIFDLIISLSFIVIPPALLYLLRKRKLSREYRFIVISFSLLIVLSGLTQLSEAYHLRQPIYHLVGIFKGLTALVSVACAVSIWPLILKIIKSPSTKDLQAANLALQKQIAFRNKNEEQTKKQKLGLEQLLKQRNKDLEQTAHKLQVEIDEHKASQSQVAFQASLLDQVNSAIIATDLDFRISYWNRHAETTFGWKRHEVIGRPVLVFMTVGKKRKVGMKFLQKLRKSKSFSGDISVPHKKGHNIPLDIDCSPLFNAENRQIGFTAVAVDITDHVTYENQLEDEKAQAERLAVAKQDFLATMSHEIRTPLNVIIGMARLLSDSQPRNDQQEHLRSLMFSANHLLTIINDILDMAKIEAGKIQLEKVDFNITEVLEGLEKSFALKITEKGLDFSIDRDESVPEWLVGDQVRLTQILNNLVSNAVKFTDEGFIRIKVRAYPRGNQQQRLSFNIIDSGIGISKDKLEHIFDNYTQAKADTTRRYGGTGLGLSICKRLVEVQGGEISVSSEEGLGTTFSFNLDYASSSRKEVRSLPEIDEYSLENVHLLLVDDDEANCIVASSFLNKMGVQVDFAHNGEEALQAVQQQDYNIVLMDLQMPIMSGYDATRAIRQLGGAYSDLPIIALTAHVVSDVRDRVREAGMNDYLSKPFDPEKLNTILARHLNLIPRQPLQPAEEEIVSLRQLLETYQDDHQFVQTLLSSLTESYSQLDQQLKEIVKHRDIISLRRMIHKMQPTLKMMNQWQLQEKLLELREGLMTGETDEQVIGQLMNQISQLTDKSQQMLYEISQEMNHETKLI